jgi:hypothetical protein
MTENEALESTVTLQLHVHIPVPISWKDSKTGGLEVKLPLCLTKYRAMKTYEGVSKSFRTGRLKRGLPMV